jgi:hypothetical protein
MKNFVGFDSLIVEDDIWSPNVVGRNMELLHSTVFLGVPHQLVVVPKLKKINRV